MKGEQNKALFFSALRELGNNSRKPNNTLQGQYGDTIPSANRDVGLYRVDEPQCGGANGGIPQKNYKKFGNGVWMNIATIALVLMLYALLGVE